MIVESPYSLNGCWDRSKGGDQDEALKPSFAPDVINAASHLTRPISLSYLEIS